MSTVAVDESKRSVSTTLVPLQQIRLNWNRFNIDSLIHSIPVLAPLLDFPADVEVGGVYPLQLLP
jgi:hypothetical protein